MNLFKRFCGRRGSESQPPPAGSIPCEFDFPFAFASASPAPTVPEQLFAFPALSSSNPSSTTAAFQGPASQPAMFPQLVNGGVQDDPIPVASMYPNLNADPGLHSNSFSFSFGGAGQSSSSRGKDSVADMEDSSESEASDHPISVRSLAQFSVSDTFCFSEL